MGFETIHRIKVGDALELAYREVGAGEPLVFVHGWPLSSLTWRKVVGPLSEGFRCIAPDLPGAGESLVEAPRELSLDALGRALGGFLDALGLERATLVGHDSGGSVVRSFAVASPERVARLVLADTEVPGHRPLFVSVVERLARLPGAERLMRGLFGSKRLARSPLGFGLCFADLARFDFDEFYATLVEPNARSAAAVAGAHEFMLRFDFGEVDATASGYHRLRMPKCLLWGAKDRIFPPEQGRRLAEMLPEPKRYALVPGVGLFVHEEKPEEWLRHVRAFLAESPH